MTLNLTIESTMGLSRRFLNLIVDNRIRGAQSLRCIDRQQFFNTTPAPPPNGSGSESEGPQDATAWAPAADASDQKNKQAAAVPLKIEMIRLPSPSFSFRASASDLNDQRMHCFPVADRRVICADQSGRGFLLEADTRRVVTMPRLHKPKSMPISIFVPSDVPSDDVDDLDGDVGDGGSLFIMDRITKPEAACSAQQNCQFEVFHYRKPAAFISKSWDCELLPPPPYVRDTTCWHSCPEISSYAVVKGGSQICISVEGVGTYYLHTASYTWEVVGKWTLPFYGKVEYMPELKLWFGFSAKDRHLAAADLSTMDSQPQLVDTWRELERPEEWQEIHDPQLVNLGSGRFCIARFFHTKAPNGDFGDELSDQNFAVLTGVEVVPHVHDANGSSNANASGGNGKVKLGMINHKSKFHKSSGSDDTITVVL